MCDGGALAALVQPRRPASEVSMPPEWHEAVVGEDEGGVIGARLIIEEQRERRSAPRSPPRSATARRLAPNIGASTAGNNA